MSPQRFPPAWYPDPAQAGRLRRWDGAAWTSDTRPLPGWVLTVNLAPGPQSRPGRARRRLWAASLAAVVVAVIAGLSLRQATPPGDRIRDAAFVRSAGTICASTRDRVVEVNPPTGGLGEAEALRIERLTSGFSRMLGELDALPVARAEDVPHVRRWLAAWDIYIALGREYADALRAGDRAKSDEVNQASANPKREIDRFAAVNGIDACVF